MKGFLKRHWRKIVGAAVTLPVVAFVVLCLVIGSSVRGAVSAAQERHPGGPTEALLAVAQDEDLGLSERNRAIWALGQLGSPEALPVLEAMVTANGCDHANRICQYELEKAIAGCAGGTNAGAWIWRHGDLAVAD